MGLLMGIGGIVWASIAFYYRLFGPAIIPFGYTVFTIFNFLYFSFSKNFKRVRFFQVLTSLLLPFAFQWSLGGFIPSGAVMLWAMVALAGSLTFQGSRLSIKWLMAYLLFTIFSGIIDDAVNAFSITVSSRNTTLFFVINIAVISAIVFGLNIYFITKREELKSKLTEVTALLKKMLGRYLSTEVMNAFIENPSALELGGERKSVTIMMTDIRGFTALAERLQPEQVVKLLNTYFEVMVEVIHKYNGTINEIVGDGLLVVFGAPQKMSDRAQRAVACAVEMQNTMKEVNQLNRSQGLPALEMGIGLNEDEVIVGNIGSSKRCKYAVVGGGGNMTSRIESYTVGGQILISESVRKKAGSALRIDGQREILPKGAETPFVVYDVGGIAGQYNHALEHKDPHLAALVLEIPILYTVLEGKNVETMIRKGSLQKLSGKSAELLLNESFEPMLNLKIHLDKVGGRLAGYDFYGKIMGCWGKKGLIHELRFTSMPPEIDAYFKAHLRCAGAAESIPKEKQLTNQTE